jgi:hypothetical protein
MYAPFVIHALRGKMKTRPSQFSIIYEREKQKAMLLSVNPAEKYVK